MKSMVNRFFLSKIDSTQRSSVKNVIAKPISMVLVLLYTPLLLAYLGDEKYGLWSTMISIINWINYFDVGIGHGLRNTLSKLLSERDYEGAKKSVSTSYIILTIIALILLLMSIIIVVFIDWSTLLNTKIHIRLPLLICFVFICINFVLSLSNTLLYSLQKSEIVAVRNCFVQFINILGILILRLKYESSLVGVSIVFGCSNMLVYICTSISIFRKNKCIVPSIKCFDKNRIGDIAGIGIKFFLIQMACLTLYSTDNLIITYLFGADKTTPFNICNKAYDAIYGIFAAACVPYWSKTTVAIAKRNYDWISKSIKKLNALALLFCVMNCCFTVFYKTIANIWVGKSLDYPPGLEIIMCIYYCLYTIVTANVQFINGSGKINCQLIVMTFMGVMNIPLSFCFASTLGLGVNGVRLATTVLMGIACIIFPLNLKQIVNSIFCKKISE